MGFNPRVIRDMTLEQKKRYAKRVAGMYSSIAVAHGIGLMLLGVAGIIVAARHVHF